MLEDQKSRGMGITKLRNRRARRMTIHMDRKERKPDDISGAIRNYGSRATRNRGAFLSRSDQGTL